MNTVTKRRVLYVDHVASRVAQMRDIIGSQGHDLMTAATGELGIDVALTRQPDLVILDLALPRMTGIEVIARLRASPETTAIPIIALSSVPCSSAPGLSMYCRRPLDVAGFAMLLRELLGPAPGVAAVRASGAAPRRARRLGDVAPSLYERRL